MRRVLVFSLGLLGACSGATPVEDAGQEGDGGWHSRLYPEDWTPSFTDDAGRFLHDFSYAGYAHGERAPMPTSSFIVHVAMDGGDMTGDVQGALNAVAALDGGVVLLGPGRFRIDGTLTVTHSGVVLKGSGRDKTWLVFTKSFGLDYAGHLRFGGAQQLVGNWPLLEDGVTRSVSVKVGASDAGALSVGDEVAVGHVITDEYVAEHGMTGFWSAFNGTWQPFAWRRVTAVAGDGTVTLDVPLRAVERTRDAASLRRVTGQLREVGLEDLSLTNAVEPGAAYAATQVAAVSFSGVADGWVRRVSSFSEVDGGAQLQSVGLRLHQVNRVTVDDVHLAKAQHRGGGGNGYLFEVRQSSEVLFKDSTATEGRHNFIQNWGFGTSGCVWLRVVSEGGFATAQPGGTQGGVGYSEFHHSLATANLLDSSRFDDGFSIINRRLESTGAGHTGTENVFWNVSGAGLLRSMQWGWGYVIGTDGLEVALDEVFIAEGTQPLDWAEGLDAGATLQPRSLYEDQLRRRLGR
ncbi:MAG: hypothetical protein AB1938_15035 [Myxococcota bacterium]